MSPAGENPGDPAKGHRGARDGEERLAHPDRIPVPVAPAADGTALRLLDQTRLPAHEKYLTLTTADEVAEAIRSLRVRGAPAIGVAGAFGMALGLKTAGRDVDAAEIDRLHDLLLETRPTGRNLAWALRRVREASSEAPPAAAAAAAWAEALRVLTEETDACRRIGEAGVELLPPPHRTVLTHCNAGALATTGIGTALAPLYLAHARGVAPPVAACETRPVLQGARLTAWELARSGIPVTVVTDSMAGALMARGEVGIVIVGADAVAMNGDVANKIGTYSLAVLAAHHGIPFYVAAPRSTFDTSFASGAEIPIEMRSEHEVRTSAGTATGPARPVTVPAEAHVWNPAFDVTPAYLITALVTDGGVLRPPYEATVQNLIHPTQPSTDNR